MPVLAQTIEGSAAVGRCAASQDLGSVNIPDRDVGHDLASNDYSPYGETLDQERGPGDGHTDPMTMASPQVQARRQETIQTTLGYNGFFIGLGIGIAIGDAMLNDDGGDDSPKQCDDSSQRGNPYHGEPGTWPEHPRGKQDRLYGPNGTPAVDIDYVHDHGHGSPHSHSWDN